MRTSDIYDGGFDEDVQRGPTDSCPECGGHVRTNIAETVCEDCGLIIDDHTIDRGPEWDRDDGDDAPEQPDVPVTPARHYHGFSKATSIRRNAKSNEPGNEKRRSITRMRRDHVRGEWRSKQEHNLDYGLAEIHRIASALGLSETLHDRACQLFQTAQKQHLLRGRSIEAIAAASVYGACRCDGQSWLFADIAPLAQVDQSRVRNAYRVLNEELGLPTQPAQPTQFVPRLASELGCTHPVRRRARQLAKRAVDTGVAAGMHPAGFAAACLYMAACVHDEPLTQADAAAAAEVTVGTVRKHRDRVLSVVE